MNVLVIYDSAYGNTRQIADEIANATGTNAKLVKDTKTEEVMAADLIIVGSPTQGGQALPSLKNFLASLPDGALKGKEAAAFDTRFAVDQHGFGLKILMKTIGFAAAKLAKQLKGKGARLVGEPAGFIVTRQEGPLEQGELVRANRWAKSLLDG